MEGRLKIRRRLALFGSLLSERAALLRLAVQGLGHLCGAADFAQSQNLHLKFAGVVANLQQVSNLHLAGGLGRVAVGLNPAQVAGMRGERARLEEARGPQPFIDPDVIQRR